MIVGVASFHCYYMVCFDLFFFVFYGDLQALHLLTHSSPTRRSSVLLGLDPVALTNAASRARDGGRPHAARDLADLVEALGGPARASEIGVPLPTGADGKPAYA